MIPLVPLTQFGAPATRPHNSIPQPNNLYSLCVGGGWVDAAAYQAHTVCNLERKRGYLLSSVSGRTHCIPAHKNTIPKCYAIVQAEVQMVHICPRKLKCYSFSSPPASCSTYGLQHFAMPATPSLADHLDNSRKPYILGQLLAQKVKKSN